MLMIAFLNGRFVPETQALISVNDRGFTYGDGLFETIRVIHGRLFQMTSHLERLKRGAEFLKISSPFGPEKLTAFAAQLIAKNKKQNAILRVTLTRGAGERGYMPDPKSKPTLAMTLHRVPKFVPVPQWSLATSSYRIPFANPLTAFKTLNKLAHIMARSEARAKGADEALLLNTNGEVTEAASGNLFWISRGRVCTVRLECGALPGITRAAVLEICQAMDLATSECAIRPRDLRRARGIFITQSAYGIVPVFALDGRPVKPSPLVERIRRAYQALLSGPRTD